ncbi:MAG: hypothetical protein ACOY46_13590 [Bacillota bacterium]
MNDIWALPSGEWVIYTDEDDIIKDLLTLSDLKVVTSYHGIIKKHRAMQFKFPNREDLLMYICHAARFNYSKVLKIYKHPGTGYNDFFPDAVQQPTLFVEVNPRRKKDGKKSRKL